MDEKKIAQEPHRHDPYGHDHHDHHGPHGHHGGHDGKKPRRNEDRYKRRHHSDYHHGDELLHVENLVVEYTSGKQIVHAVNGISFDLKRGQSLGLVGESGCGKSTVAKALLRVLPDVGAGIPEGEVWFKGRELVTLPEKEMEHIRGAQISMIFQDPMTALNPTRRVLTQVAGCIKLHNPGMTKRESEARAIDMLKAVGINEDRVRDFPNQFSGGMQQRVEVAIGLSCNPDLLLADEPTTALDVTIQAQVLEMMRDLMHKRDTALILITHNLGIVADMCDHIAVFYGGEIIEYGDKYEIFKAPSHPYTIGLFGAVPSLTDDKARLTPIDGIMPEPSDLPAGCKFHTRCPYVTDVCRDGPVPNIELGGTHRCKCHHIAEVRAAREKEEAKA